jgi:hypothetical protein
VSRERRVGESGDGRNVSKPVTPGHNDDDDDDDDDDVLTMHPRNAVAMAIRLQWHPIMTPKALNHGLWDGPPSATLILCASVVQVGISSAACE